MVFAHDTEVALIAAAALVNTAPRRGADPREPGPASEDGRSTDVDTLERPADLAAFCAGHGWTGRIDADAAELAAVQALRQRLRGLWQADEQGVVALTNALLAEGAALPRLVDHDGFGWHVHATEPDAPLATRMTVEAAMAVVDVVREGELQRLRMCEADDCDHVVVDLSRNRSRRFCEGGCAARAHSAAYRARREGSSC